MVRDPIKVLLIENDPLDVEVNGNTFEYKGKTHVLVILTDITERKETEKDLVDYQKQLRSQAAQSSQTEERERRNISNYLHDRIGQALVVMRMKLGELKGGKTSVNITDLSRKICDEFQAQAQNGKIWVEGEEGKGACFKIALKTTDRA